MPSECYYLWGYMCYKDMPDPGNQRLDLYLPNYQLSIGQKLEFCMIHISKIKSNVNQEHLHQVY